MNEYNKCICSNYIPSYRCTETPTKEHIARSTSDDRTGVRKLFRRFTCRINYTFVPILV